VHNWFIWCGVLVGPRPILKGDGRAGDDGPVSRARVRPSAGVVAVYAATMAAFGYAVVSLYWAAGGRGLLGTVGGFAERLARQGGAVPVLLAVAVVAARAAGGVLALALARPWTGWCAACLLGASVVASVLLMGNGGLNVLAGRLVLAGVIRPAGAVDGAAMRWHAGVWDLWFQVWGIFLALAAAGYWR